MSSLQKAIEENTAAIIALTAALTATPTSTVTVSLPPPEEAAPDTGSNDKSEPAVAQALSYEKDVKPWAIKLAAKDKPAFLAILAKHQATKGSELAPRVLAAALSDIKAALNG